MLLKLENIGKISAAEVELNGITVIAGENNTGKSTVGKVLFCIFNSFYKIKQKIDEERQGSIVEILTNANYLGIFIGSHVEVVEFAQALLSEKKNYYKNDSLLKKDIEEFCEGQSNLLPLESPDIDLVVERISAILSISEEEILKKVLQKKLNSEFNAQINNSYSKDRGKIQLAIKDIEVEVAIENNEIENIRNNLELNTEVIYIDDPFILDDLSNKMITPSLHYANHQMHLKQVLGKVDERSEIKSALSEIITAKKIEGILEKINSICSGQMVKNRMNFGYQRADSEVVLNVKNISTGLKTFVILKTLLLNNSLEENGTIVLDEPEIHLHPQWQLLFAELIVLLQKEFNMHILLNTHSPYFLRAIQVYSAKYEIADKCKYYLSENIGEKATLKDVTTEIDQIYSRLAKPFETLEMERNSDEKPTQ